MSVQMRFSKPNRTKTECYELTCRSSRTLTVHLQSTQKPSATPGSAAWPTENICALCTHCGAALGTKGMRDAGGFGSILVAPHLHHCPSSTTTGHISSHTAQHFLITFYSTFNLLQNKLKHFQSAGLGAKPSLYVKQGAAPPWPPSNFRMRVNN